MGLFSGRTSRVDDRADGDEAELVDPSDLQFAAIAVADGFAEHDEAALARLDAAGRAEQQRARWALFRHIDGIWDDAKAQGLIPADRPEYNAVAGMRDLLMNLCGQADLAADADPEK